MNLRRIQTTLLVFFALTTVGGAALAYRQYQELIALRAGMLAKDERADLQKRLWDAERRAQAAESTEKPVAGMESLPPPPDEPETGDRPRPPFGRGRADNFLAMLENPELQRLMAIQQKAGLDFRYAGLFRKLGLSPAQLDRFKNLLVEKQASMMDVMAAARAQGINPRTDPEGFRQLVANAQAEVDTAIKTAIGDNAYAEYSAYEQTFPQRATTDLLAQRLSYTSTPLSETQSSALVSILASTGSSANGGMRVAVANGAVMAMGGTFGGPSTQITDATLAQAQGVLAGAQLEALRQLQQEQQAQAELAAAMRRPPATTPASTATTGPGGG